MDLFPVLNKPYHLNGDGKLPIITPQADIGGNPQYGSRIFKADVVTDTYSGTAAVKLIHKRPLRTGDVHIERGRRELAYNIQMIKHAGQARRHHLVVPFAAAEALDYIYIIMPLMDKSLADHIQYRFDEQEPMDDLEMFPVAFCVLDALSWLHGQNPPIIHRDIKPENIMSVAGSWQVYLADLGIAKRVIDPHITQDHVIGTPYYMSQQALTREQMDPRDDLYAVGVMCYRLLTCQYPYGEGVTNPEDVGKIVIDPNNRPDRPNFLNASISEETDRFVRRLMERDRECRPYSARAASISCIQAYRLVAKERRQERPTPRHVSTIETVEIKRASRGIGRAQLFAWRIVPRKQREWHEVPCVCDYTGYQARIRIRGLPEYKPCPYCNTGDPWCQPGLIPIETRNIALFWGQAEVVIYGILAAAVLVLLYVLVNYAHF
jgi:serine/threonine protein kinase